MIVSLYELVVAVAHNLRDAVEGVTDTGATQLNEMRDQARSVEMDGRYDGSDLLWREPEATDAGLTGDNPLGVIDFAQNGGRFTLSGNWSQTSGVPSGVTYTLLNLGGRGSPVRAILRALQLAVAALGLRRPVEDEMTAYVPGTYDYTIPAAYMSIERVYVRRLYDGVPRRLDLHYGAADGYTVRQASRVVSLNLLLLEGDRLGMVGEVPVTLPTTWAGTEDFPLEAVVNGAIEFLDRAGTSEEQQIGQQQYADRVRTVPLYRRANSIALPPPPVVTLTRGSAPKGVWG